MKRKFGNMTIEAEDIQVVGVGCNDKGYTKIYTVVIRLKTTIPDINSLSYTTDIYKDKEIRISKTEYEKFGKELCEWCS